MAFYKKYTAQMGLLFYKSVPPGRKVFINHIKSWRFIKKRLAHTALKQHAHSLFLHLLIARETDLTIDVMIDRSAAYVLQRPAFISQLRMAHRPIFPV